MAQFIRKLLFLLDPWSRRRLGFLFAAILLTALLETASLGLFFPIMQMIVDPGQVPSWFPQVLAEMTPARRTVTVALSFGVFFAFKNMALLATTYLNNRLSCAMMARFEHRLFSHYLRQPYPVHLGRNTSHIIQSLTLNALRVFDCVRTLLNITLELLMIAGGVAVLVTVEPWITVGSAMVFGSVGFVIFRVIAPLMREWGARSVTVERGLIRTIQHAFNSVRSIKIQHRERYFEDGFRHLIFQEAYLRTMSYTMQHIPRLFVELVVVLGFLGIVVGLMVTRGSLTEILPTLGLFGMVALRLMPSLNRILQGASDLKLRSPAVELIHADLDGEPLADYVSGAETAVEPLPFEREIRLDAVTFSYPRSDRAAIRGLSLTIPKGRSVGLVGPSGAGKSTLSEIILGLLRPDGGRLLIDGADAATDIGRWQSRIGYVPQQTYVMDDTLRRNVAFGLDDARIDEERLRAAIRMSHLDAVVERLPQGLDTVVGENGVRLSGGQRQRLGIARALYHDPDVIVLDEATSALDNETEREISSAIEELSGQKTLIIVAHRLSTVRRCDRIVYLKDGAMVAEADFETLLATNEDFRRMVDLGTLETGCS
ncbi:MAG: ABC transporter ATP-binding protein [Alphaproteobacteria bacterium]|nr:ABC transporter ATP-binding protein [Alphaproteobacteria bacterium]